MIITSSTYFLRQLNRYIQHEFTKRHAKKNQKEKEKLKLNLKDHYKCACKRKLLPINEGRSFFP